MINTSETSHSRRKWRFCTIVVEILGNYIASTAFFLSRWPIGGDHVGLSIAVNGRLGVRVGLSEAKSEGEPLVVMMTGG